MRIEQAKNDALDVRLTGHLLCCSHLTSPSYSLPLLTYSPLPPEFVLLATSEVVAINGAMKLKLRVKVPEKGRAA